MGKTALIVVLVLIVLGIGYVERHKIEAMFGMIPTPTGTIATTDQNAAPVASPDLAMTANPATSTVANNIYQWKTDAKKGQYLTDFQGMTLYVFDKDTTGVSNCAGSCAAIWPAYSSGATAQGTFPDHIGLITRADGKMQFAWDGKPLYYYAPDKVAGDLKGDGVDGIWHIVAPTK